MERMTERNPGQKALTIPISVFRKWTGFFFFFFFLITSSTNVCVCECECGWVGEERGVQMPRKLVITALSSLAPDVSRGIADADS